MEPKMLLQYLVVLIPFMINVTSCLGESINESVRGFTTSQIHSKPMWNATYMDKLKQDLLLNYDKFARPTEHYNMTNVSIGLTLLHVEVNEHRSTLSAIVWVKLSWKDEKLKWNVSDYGELSTVRFADHEIWQPDIALYNSATGSTVSHLGGVHCLVYDDGTIIWVPPAELVALCEFNVRYWPFDTQSCTLNLGSWSYDGNEIDLQLIRDDVEMDMVVTNREWDITNTSATRNVNYFECCGGPYIDARFTFTLTRRSATYKAAIAVSALVIILLTLGSFWLPPQAGEKIILNSCTCLMITVFLIYFMQKIPMIGLQTPLAVLFYTSSLYISGFSMLVSIIVIWISRTQHNHSLPWVIKRPLTGLLRKWLVLDHYINPSSLTSQRATAEEMCDHRVTEFEDDHTSDEHYFFRRSLNKVSLQQDWVLLATAIDRILFFFYCFLFVILSGVYLI